MSAAYDVVIPTSGRASLARLLDALQSGCGQAPERVVVVDDRRAPASPLALPGDGAGARIDVVRGGGRGPAAARNAGWRAGTAPWVAFLDDDVVPAEDWRARLTEDLAGASAGVGGSQGRVRVPLPVGRRPTDRERDVHGLEHAQWATADLAYRRAALVATGGFDERFRHAYREDADLGLRVTQRGWHLVRGTRTVTHPVGDAPWWVSLPRQRGNAEDPFMDALHGRDWRTRAGAPRGRLRRHVATAAAGGAASALALTGRPRAAAFAAAAWAAGTVELAAARIAPGPRAPGEVAAMAVTSAAMPFAASGYALLGRATAGRRRRQPGPRPAPLAVLLDRDGTLIHDVPYNGDPARVAPMPGAREALARLREAGLPPAVVSNQSGIARGMLSDGDLRAVNARVERLLGPFDAWLHCPHGPQDGCACRKPRPGMLVDAARRLGVPPHACVMVGDIGADVEAAQAAGSAAVLVPTPRTRVEEIAAAPVVAPDLLTAADLILEEARA